MASRNYSISYFIKKIPTDQRFKFASGISRLASLLQVPEKWLWYIIDTETNGTFSPQIKGSSGFVGLIQFGADAAKDLGTTQKQLLRMNHVEQLVYVEKYFLLRKKSLGKPNYLADLYLFVLYPNKQIISNYTYNQPFLSQSPLAYGMQAAFLYGKANPSISLPVGVSYYMSKSTIEQGFSKKYADNSLVTEILQDDLDISPDQKIQATQSIVPQEPLRGYFEHIHKDSQFTTLQQLITYYHWVNPKTPSLAISVEELLSIQGTDDTTITNATRIRARYISTESSSVSQSREGDLIKIGTKILIPLACLNTSRVFSEVSTVISEIDNVAGFISSTMEKIIASPGYKLAFNNIELGVLTKQSVSATVWVWCKALGGTPLQVSGNIFDISPFLLNLTTQQTKEGGSFNLTLPAITTKSLEGVFSMEGLNIFQAQQPGYFAKSSSERMIGNEIKRENFFFSNMIQQNDLVFIRFEQLEDEIDRRSIQRDSTQKILDPIISKNQLPGKIYDMIGLVDSNRIAFSAENNSMQITIAGRDLNKLLIEDGTYWLNIPDSVINQGIFVNQNPEEWGRIRERYGSIENTRASDTPLQHLDTTSIASLKDQSLSEYLSYIFSRLLTTEIVPDGLFDAYDTPEKQRTTTYAKQDPIANTFYNVKSAGIWQIVKVIFDESTKNRQIIDDSLPTYEGSILGAIQKYCNDPWVEFFGDTYGDQFFFTIRKCPYDKISVESLLTLTTPENGFEIYEDAVLSDQFEWNNESYCWYRITPIHYNEGMKLELLTEQMPVLYFREYNEVFGNRSFDKPINYIPFEPYYAAMGDNRDQNTIFNEQIQKDLRFAVETTAYLPFTRKGSITIRGDRRIKRGMWIRYKPTNEVFYVDSVSQYFTSSDNVIDRFTVLNVSRGMREYNEAGQYILPFYFKIINTDSEKKKPQKQQVDIFDNEFPILVYFDTDEASFIDPYRDQSILRISDEKGIKEREALRNVSDKQILQLAQELKDDNSLDFVINGHTDTNLTRYVGGNLQLSEDRAYYTLQQIKQAYLQLGGKIEDIEARISYKGFGSTVPIEKSSPTQTDLEVRFLSRRVTVLAKIKTLSSPDNSNKGEGLKTWKVNSDIFNYFIKRGQKWDKIPDDIYQILLGETSSQVKDKSKPLQSTKDANLSKE